MLLYAEEARAIGRLAVEQRRQPAEQAAYLVRQQLEALGALTAVNGDPQVVELTDNDQQQQ
jgi:hypothetical protein